MASATDNFNRSTGIGANWTTVTAAWEIVDNVEARLAIAGSNNGSSYYNGISPGGAQYVWGRVGGGFVDDVVDFGTGPAIRINTSNGACYALLINTAASGEVQLFRIASDGSYNLIATDSSGSTPVANDTFELRAIGTGTNNLSVYKNGSLLFQATDSNISSGSVGLAGRVWDFPTRWTDWEGGDLYALEQAAFRFRNDNGSESAATWLAAQDTNITQPVATNTRLRVQVQATTGDPSSTQFRLDYKKSTDSAYKPVEVAGVGSVAFGAAGTVSAGGTTSISVPYPTGITRGDLLVLSLAVRPQGATITTPTGWTAPSNNTGTGGAGGEATDAGTVKVAVFTKEADGTETGNLAVTVGNTPNAGMGRMFRYSRTTGKQWSVACANGADNDGGTGWSVTGNVDPGITAGDMVIVSTALNTDAPTWSSQALSATGVTFGAANERQDTGVTTGNDIKLMVSDHAVSSGTSSAAPVYTATASATSPEGASVFLRIRQTDQPIQLAPSGNVAASGEATTQQLTGGSGTFVAGRLQDDENPADTVDIGSAGYTELEWCLAASSAAANGDIYQFRVTENGIELGTYTVTAEWTIGSGGPTYTLTAEAGSYAITGTAAGLRAARRILAEAGAYSLTGTAANLRLTKRIAAESGSYSITGTAAGFRASRRISAEAGAYSITGFDVAFTRARRMLADAGSYLIVGQDVGLRASRRLTLDAGSYAITGTAAQLRRIRLLTANPGSYVITGTAAGLRASRRFTAEAGAYLITGTPAALRRLLRLVAEAGAYSITGQAAQLRFNRRLVAESGMYVITGSDAVFQYIRGIVGPFRARLLIASLTTPSVVAAAYRTPGLTLVTLTPSLTAEDA
jgi:hypothetical protein